MDQEFKLTSRQVHFLRALIKVCKNHEVSITATQETIMIGGLKINQLNTDGCHVLHPERKKAGLFVTDKTVISTKD